MRTFLVVFVLILWAAVALVICADVSQRIGRIPLIGGHHLVLGADSGRVTLAHLTVPGDEKLTRVMREASAGGNLRVETRTRLLSATCFAPRAPTFSRSAGFWYGMVSPSGMGLSVLQLPYWAMIAPAIGLSAYLIHQRWQRSIDTSTCSVCGYDLRATPDRCPECGTVIGGRDDG